MPHSPEADDGKGKIRQVLDSYIDGIFRTGESRFEAHKTGLHEENQAGRKDKPEDVDQGRFIHRRVLSIRSGFAVIQKLTCQTMLVREWSKRILSTGQGKTLPDVGVANRKRRNTSEQELTSVDSFTHEVNKNVRMIAAGPPYKGVL